MALSFAVKVKLSALSVFFFVKLWRELRTRHTFDRCEGYEIEARTKIQFPVRSYINSTQNKV